MAVIYKLFPIICLLLVDFASAIIVGNKFEGNLAPDDTEGLKDDEKNKQKSGFNSDQITRVMKEYVTENPIDPGEQCRFGKEGCLEFLEMYLKRCRTGDCYTLDNFQLVKFPDGFEIEVPNLNQYEFARSIFRRSKAMKEVRFYDIPAKLSRRFNGPSLNSLESFNKNILKNNLPNMSLMGDVNRTILTEVLYKATLHYLTYIYENPFGAERNEHKFFRLFFRWKQRRWLVGTAKNIARVKRVSLGMRKLKSIMDAYLLYLNTSGAVGHNRLNLSYSKLVKHAIIKLVGDKRVSFLMSDYMLRFPINVKTYCTGNSPADCYSMLLKYTDRCEDGDCMTFDPVMLLDEKDYLNIELPQLNELDLSFALFSGSRAKSNLFLDFILRRKDRITLPVFANKLLKLNTDGRQYNNRDHRVFSKFLYFASIYYKRRNMMGRFKKLFCKSVEKTLKEYLGDIVSSTPVNLNKERVTAMFVAYRNYMFASKFGENKEDVVGYVQKTNDVFLYYMDSYNLLKDSKKKEKEIFDLKIKPEEEEMKEREELGEEVVDEEKEKELKKAEKVKEDKPKKRKAKTKNIFNFENEEDRMYEDRMYEDDYKKEPFVVVDYEKPSTSELFYID